MHEYYPYWRTTQQATWVSIKIDLARTPALRLSLAAFPSFLSSLCSHFATAAQLNLQLSSWTQNRRGFPRDSH